MATETTNLSVNQFFSNQAPTDHHLDETDEFLDFGKFIKNFNNDEVAEFFEISKTIEWISKNKFTRVALQFPDCFIDYSSSLARNIESQTSAKVFLLADTTYRSCCIDEIATAHANCDALVHYGDACLSAPSEKIPVQYILCRLPLAVDDVLKALAEKLESADNVLLLSDAPYGHALDAMKDRLSKNVDVANVIDMDSTLAAKSSEEVCLGRYVPLRFRECSEATVMFVGNTTSSLLPLWLMSYPQCTNIIHYDPLQPGAVQEKSVSSWRQLRKRLFLIEKLRDANTVGLVVGSVGVRGHREAVLRMRELCKKAGKKIYVISVGKVNVPKLSNFTSDIDVFVLLSCPFGVLLDCSDHFRPVLSMFEAEKALNPSSNWLADKGWSADFNSFSSDAIGERDGEEVDVSLVTGRVRTTREQTAETELTEGKVALYTAGDYFASRTWKGLDDGIRVDESTEMTEGRSGVAQGYSMQNQPELQ